MRPEPDVWPVTEFWHPWEQTACVLHKNVGALLEHRGDDEVGLGDMRRTGCVADDPTIADEVDGGVE
jgi:hypothetical protein